MKKTFSLYVLLVLSIFSVCAEDTLEMDGITIIGNSELPKALYIIPWKRPDNISSAGKPVNSLTKQALVPIERERFQRRLTYFDVY